METRSKFIILSLCIILVSCSLLACKPNSGSAKSIPRIYSQDFKTDVAWIVTEWNGKPGGYGSGFLVDRERGAFYTNKHVSNEFNSYGKGSHKIFFNGKVYNAEIVEVPPLRDAALVRITDTFDPSEFPDPAPFAGEKLKVGDRIVFEGFHPHPYLIIESDKTGGYNERLVPIWEKYYNLGTRNMDRKREVVFEKITGRVTELNARVHFESTGATIDAVRELSNTYVMARTDRDHKFSFGGLSGTVVRNTKGETVGMITLERANYEPDSGGAEKSPDGTSYVKQVYNIIGFTPIDSIVNLRKYLNSK